MADPIKKLTLEEYHAAVMFSHAADQFERDAADRLTTEDAGSIRVMHAARKAAGAASTLAQTMWRALSPEQQKEEMDRQQAASERKCPEM